MTRCRINDHRHVIMLRRRPACRARALLTTSGQEYFRAKVLTYICSLL